MADEISRLGFEIDTTGLAKAKAAATDTATSVGKLGEEVDKLGNKSKQTSQSTGTLGEKLAAVGNASRNFGDHVQGLQSRVGNLAQAFGIATGSGSGVALNAVLQTANGGMSALAGVMGRFGPVASGITSGIGALATGYIGLNTALAVAQDKFTQSEARIRQAIGSAELAREAFDKLQQSAAETGISFDAASGAFIRLARNKDALGATTAELLTLTETIQKLGVVSGTGQGELASGMMQLSQALASGRLNGDELRSILENMPALAKAIADGLGVGVGQLRSMGAAGELTGDKVFKAILSQSDKVRKDFADLPDTVERSYQRMSDKATALAAELGKAFNSSSITQGIINAISAGIDGARDSIKETPVQQRIARLKEAISAKEKGTASSYNYASSQSVPEMKKELQDLTYQQYLESRKADRVQIGEQAGAERADITRGLGVAQNVDDFAKKAKTATEQVNDLTKGIARAYELMNEPGADTAKLTKDIATMNAGLVVVKQSALDDASAFDKFNRSITQLRQQISLGGGGGGMDIVKQAQDLVSSNSRQGVGLSMNAAIDSVTRERGLRSALDVEGIDRQTEAQKRLISTVGASAAAVRESEIAQAGLDFQFKTFGTITGPVVTTAVNNYTSAIRRLKSANDELSKSQAFQGIKDSLSVISAQSGAVGAGAYAMRRAQAEADAAIADRGMPGIGAEQMRLFDAREGLGAKQTLESLERDAKYSRSLSGVAGNPIARRELEMQRRIEDAQRNAPTESGSSIADSVRAKADAEREESLASQTAEMRQQLEFAKQQVGLLNLTGEKLAVETALLQKKRELQAAGVLETEAAYQQQMAVTAELAKQNFQLDLSRERAGEMTKIWDNAFKGIQQSLAQAFEIGFSRGENRGRRFLSSLGNLAAQTASQIMSALVLSPIQQAGTSFFKSLIPNIFGGGSGVSADADIQGGEDFYGNLIPSARGNVFRSGAIVPFRLGGVVSRPTAFPMSGGSTGLMGEAGEEAIMPLKRGSDGRLGVAGASGGNVSIQVFDQRSAGNSAPVEVQERRGDGGQRMIQLMVRDEVKRVIRSGEADREMSGSYGVERRLTRR